MNKNKILFYKILIQVSNVTILLTCIFRAEWVIKNDCILEILIFIFLPSFFFFVGFNKDFIQKASKKWTLITEKIANKIYKYVRSVQNKRIHDTVRIDSNTKPIDMPKSTKQTIRINNF